MKLSKTIIFWIALFIANPALALSSDTNKPISIEADEAMIDDIKGIAIYTGNVIVTQGSIRINSEKLTLHYSKSQSLEKAVATGSPVQFKIKPDGKKPDIHAKANRMEYYAHKDMLHLTQKAMVWQGEDKFTGEHVSYDTKRGIIRADKGKSKKGRISVTIQPKQ
ncbi:lipopolysaccharide transport periplasmic protein LptA [Candidatus Albibeggiatoa sp. nov. BB20]|uniref:lipopolysaccharide transport periplasmic protein LptA n=1 Tax=Candidatus Albibeggiatoa sp. nov. BB20 TaxID=3162723 RepID=UPI0033659D44